MNLPMITRQRGGFWLIVLSLLLSCDKQEDTSGDNEPPADDTAQDDTGDSPDPQELLLDVLAEVSEIVPTVAVVRWETSQPTTGMVRFGSDGALDHQTPSTPEGTSHEAVLLGLRADQEVTFEISVSAGELGETSAPQQVRTGALPTGLPSLLLSSHDPDASMGGFTILPLQNSERCWTTIVDAEGEYVWALEIPCQTHRTRLLPDGSGLVSHFQTAPDEPLVLRTLSFLGEVTAEVAVESGHHDFAIVDDGTWAVLGLNERTFQDGDEEVRLVADTIIEVTSDGEQQVIWDLFDHLDPVMGEEHPESGWAAGAWEWSHGNYLSYIPEDDAYYITDRSLHTVFKVDRSTGAHLWTLGDDLGDYEVTDDDPLVSAPHSIERAEDGLLLFNQHFPGQGDCSEALVIQQDEDAGTAWRSWTYQTEDCLGVEYLGNAWPLDGGNTLVVFSQRGQMDEVTPDGTVIWSLATGLDWWFSYAERIASLYTGS